MQIHELNNFSGTLGSGTYLAVDDGNDTGKLSIQELLAATEARIDNIIAGPAPSAQEVTDARLGANGVIYPSLGDAIRDQVTDLKSELNSKFSDIGFVLENQDYSGFTVTAGKTIGSNGGMVDSGSYSVWTLIADRDFQIYFNASNYAPAGGYFALGANGARYRTSDNNLPTSASPLTIAKGSTVNFSVYTAFSKFDFYWDNAFSLMANNIKLNEAQIDQVQNRLYVQEFIDLANDIPEGLYIYVPSKVRGSNYWYVLFLVHNVKASINADVWRLDRVELFKNVNGVWNYLYPIVAGGEWAMALKLDGASDFIGGLYHGNEVINSASVLIDGVKKSSFTNGHTFWCNSVRVIQNTNLYNPDVADEHSATAIRMIDITADKITIDQKIKWERAYTVDMSYVAMLSAMRLYNSTQVTDTGYTDAEYTDYDISTSGFDNPLYVNNANCAKNRKMITVFGEDSGLSFEVKCTHISPEIETRPTYVYNGSPYNKIYMSMCPDDYSVSVGDVWETTHEFKITSNM